MFGWNFISVGNILKDWVTYLSRKFRIALWVQNAMTGILETYQQYVFNRSELVGVWFPKYRISNFIDTIKSMRHFIFLYLFLISCHATLQEYFGPVREFRLGNCSIASVDDLVFASVFETWLNPIFPREEEVSFYFILPNKQIYCF